MTKRGRRNREFEETTLGGGLPPRVRRVVAQPRKPEAVATTAAPPPAPPLPVTKTLSINGPKAEDYAGIDRSVDERKLAEEPVPEPINDPEIPERSTDTKPRRRRRRG